MKKVITTVLVIALGLMSFTVLNPIIWKSEVVEVGEIPQGKPKAIEFEFVNKSSKAVKITQVQGSCGCTATDYTKTEIESGKSGKITATFNAAAVGAFTKTVTVTTTAEETPKVLTFKGIVK